MGKRSDSESRRKKHRHRRKEVYQHYVKRRQRISNFDRPPQPLEIQRIVCMYDSEQPKTNTDLEQTRHSRKIFIGNLSPETTEAELTGKINSTLIEYGGITMPGDPIVASLHLPCLGFMFVEFRTLEETEAALTLNGLEVRGKTLQIRRPADFYNNEQDFTVVVPRVHLKKIGLTSPFVDDYAQKLLVGGLDHSLAEEQVKEILQTYGEVKGLCLATEPIELTSLGFAFCEFVNPNDADRATLALNGYELRGKTLIVKKVISSQYEQELVETSLGNLRGDGPDFSLITQYPGGCIQPNFETIMYRNRPITVAEFIRAKQNIEILQYRAKELASDRAKKESELFASGVGPPGLEYDHRLYEDIAGLSGIQSVTGNLFPSLNYLIHPEGSSNIVQVAGMVDRERFFVDSEFTRIYEEVMKEVARYGTVISVVIPRESEGYSGSCVGKVYVEYSDVSSAVRSSSLISQKLWRGESLTASFFDAIKFMRNELY